MRNKQPKFFKRALKIGAVVLVVSSILWVGFQAARLQEEDGRVYQIAKLFKCLCYMKCALSVAHCVCEEPNGAQEVKRVIRNELKKRVSADQIILKINQRYGGLVASV